MTDCQIKDVFKRTQRHSITAQSFENNGEAKRKKCIKKSEINFAFRLNSSSNVSKGLLYLSVRQPQGARHHRYPQSCVYSQIASFKLLTEGYR